MNSAWLNDEPDFLTPLPTEQEEIDSANDQQRFDAELKASAMSQSEALALVLAAWGQSAYAGTNVHGDCYVGARGDIRRRWGDKCVYGRTFRDACQNAGLLKCR